MEEQEKDILLIDEVYTPITEKELENLQPMVEDFVESYELNQDRPVEEWLSEKLQTELPERTQEEVQTMAKEIVESIRTFEANKKSLSETIATGRSKESWFASKVKEATSRMSVEQTVQYLQNLDNAVNTANEALTRTILTQAGQVNLNPNLDGYLAETKHINSFNLDAVSKGHHEIIAYDPHLTGTAYGKNSVDVMIKDASLPGHQSYTQRIQLKFGKDAQATIKMIEEGDYCQRIVVPEEQVAAVQARFPDRKISSQIEYKDVKSTPITKQDVKDIRDDAQSKGKWDTANWNDLKTKDIAVNIGKQAGQAALLGAAIGAGTEVAEKLWKGEKIEVNEVAKKAIKGGADFGVKAAITGAIKAGAEKEVIKCIPKGTPAGQIANIVFVAVEDAKIIYKYANGDITWSDASNKLEETTVAAVAGLAAMGVGASKGAAMGAAMGAALAPITAGASVAFGAAIGGFVGGTLGYMAGSTIGKKIIEVKRKVTDIVKTKVTKEIKIKTDAGKPLNEVKLDQ